MLPLINTPKLLKYKIIDLFFNIKKRSSGGRAFLANYPSGKSKLLEESEKLEFK